MLYQAVPCYTRLYLAVPGCTRLYQAVPECTRLYLAVHVHVLSAREMVPELLNMRNGQSPFLVCYSVSDSLMIISAVQEMLAHLKQIRGDNMIVDFLESHPIQNIVYMFGLFVLYDDMIIII